MSGRGKCSQESAHSASGPAGKGLQKQTDSINRGGRRQTLPFYNTVNSRRGKPDRKGGWGHTIALSPSEVQYVGDVYFAAARAGTPLTELITYRGANGADLSASKRAIAKQQANIGQALKRMGIDYVAVATFERVRDNNFIEAHQLLYVPPEARDDIVRRFIDNDQVHIRPAWWRDYQYITKQRKSGEPEWEREQIKAERLWQRQAGDYIPGARLTVTKSAKALVADRPKPARNRTPSPPLVPIPVAVRSDNPVTIPTPPVQLALALDAPVINVFDLVEARRLAENESQRSLCPRRFGVGQSQYANAKRGHDPLSPWVINRMLEYVAEGIAA